jgi:hypothetical protein
VSKASVLDLIQAGKHEEILTNAFVIKTPRKVGITHDFDWTL